MGPSILTPKARQLTNSDISKVIRLGRRELGMPAFQRRLEPREIVRMIAYVRVLQGVEVGTEIEEPTEAMHPAQSNAQRESIARGRDLFVGRARCVDCHSIFNDGGRVAPDLTRVAGRMSRHQIRESIVNPSRAIASGFGESEIVTKEGRTIRGWSRREAPGTIQIFDPEEQLWTTYFKQDLRSVRASAESLMPGDLLASLSGAEISDLMAFLASLD